MHSLSLTLTMGSRVLVVRFRSKLASGFWSYCWPGQGRQKGWGKGGRKLMEAASDAVEIEPEGEEGSHEVWPKVHEEPLNVTWDATMQPPECQGGDPQSEPQSISKRQLKKQAKMAKCVGLGGSFEDCNTSSTCINIPGCPTFGIVSQSFCRQGKGKVGSEEGSGEGEEEGGGSSEEGGQGIRDGGLDPGAEG